MSETEGWLFRCSATLLLLYTRFIAFLNIRSGMLWTRTYHYRRKWAWSFQKRKHWWKKETGQAGFEPYSTKWKPHAFPTPPSVIFFLYSHYARGNITSCDLLIVQHYHSSLLVVSVPISISCDTETARSNKAISQPNPCTECDRQWKMAYCDTFISSNCRFHDIPFVLAYECSS